MSRHLFTSDLHLLHPRVSAIRGYEHVGQHDAGVLDILAANLGREDILWLLGDLTGTAREWRRALELLALLPGRKRLVMGNHDPGHPMNRNAWKHTPDLAAVFEWWGTQARVKLGRHDVMLSHFPYHRDREGTEPRYRQWRAVNTGQWLLHGHTHGKERLTYNNGWDRSLPAYGVPVREVHVGWDAWRRPVLDSELEKLISAHPSSGSAPNL